MRAELRETTSEILANYERARAADQAIDEVDLDTTGTAWFGDRVSMRWVLVHMIQDRSPRQSYGHRARTHRRSDGRSPSGLNWVN